MTLAFERFFIPSARLRTPDGLFENLDGEGLRFEWNITRDNTNEPDEAEVIVYNLSPAIIGVLLETWQAANAAGLGTGYLIDFSIGWDRVPKRIFRGDVWDFIPDERTPTDIMTIFRTGDGNRANRNSFLQKTQHKIPIAGFISYVVPLNVENGGLGLTVPAESLALVNQAASEVNLLNLGNVPAGSNTREAVTLALETIGLSWRVHNGEFIVLRGGSINRPPVVLRPGTGLINYRRRNDGSVIIDALADPDVEPGSQILVQDDNGRPFAELAYRVERVSFFGTTAENSTMNVDAAKAVVL